MAENNKAVKQYPKEIFSAFTSENYKDKDGNTRKDQFGNIVKATKMLSVNGELVDANHDEKYRPLKVYDDKLSRFVLTIVTKVPGKTTNLKGNISVDAIPGLVRNTESAHMCQMLLTQPVVGQLFSLLKKVTGLGESSLCGLNNLYHFMKHGKLNEKKEAPRDVIGKLAKSVTIMNGNMKGKTPYQILLENPNQRQSLESQYQWLEQNLAKYPNNQKQMDAIKEALEMQDRGLITPDQDSGEMAANVILGDVMLFESGPRALIRKKDKVTNLCPVYEMKIVWHMGDRYPVEVQIENYDAPCIVRETGALNPEKSKAVNTINERFRLSANDWFNLLYKIQAHMRRFEMLTAQRHFRDAEEMDRINRKKAEEEKRKTSEEAAKAAANAVARAAGQ